MQETAGTYQGDNVLLQRFIAIMEMVFTGGICQHQDSELVEAPVVLLRNLLKVLVIMALRDRSQKHQRVGNVIK